MNSWKVILATLVIFGAGLATGLLVKRHTEPAIVRVQKSTAATRVPASPGGLRLEFLRRAQRELNLNPDQREQIDKILKESQERSRQIMQPVAPELHAELQRARAQFLEVLTPEQRVRFEHLMKKPRSHDPRHFPTSRSTSAPPDPVKGP